MITPGHEERAAGPPGLARESGMETAAAGGTLTGSGRRGAFTDAGRRGAFTGSGHRVRHAAFHRDRPLAVHRTAVRGRAPASRRARRPCPRDRGLTRTRTHAYVPVWERFHTESRHAKNGRKTSLADNHTPRQTGRPGAVLGLDIGGTKLAAGVVAPDGGTRSFLVTPTLAAEGPSAVLARLFDLGAEAIDASGLPADEVAAVGIGCGGPLDSGAGILFAPPHLPGWIDVPVAALAQERYGLPAVLDNDATAAAVGEHRYGAGRGVRHMVYLTVSTGVGGGAVFDGRTYRGATGNGGEFGHLTVDRGGRRCRGCGRDGCLEAYASGTSIAERAREAVAEAAARGITTALADCRPPLAEDVSRLAAAGDPVAVELWRATVEALACGVTTLVNLFEPELVVLGGGVTRAGEQLLAPVRTAVRERAMGPVASVTRVVAAAGGPEVGVVGAAAIAYERLLAPAARGTGAADGAARPTPPVRSAGPEPLTASP